jgi:hypothetical protein
VAKVSSRSAMPTLPGLSSSWPRYGNSARTFDMIHTYVELYSRVDWK